MLRVPAVAFLALTALAESACERSASAQSAPVVAEVAAPSPARESKSVGPSGGKVGQLVFAVVGDARPGMLDDVEDYPREIVRRIYADLEAQSPRPALAVATGDYMNNRPGDGTAAAQVAEYLAASRGFGGQLFPTMGNHECANAVTSECGPEGPNGLTENYQAFLSGLLQKGLGLETRTPYYVVHVDSSDPQTPWTAKFVFVAANGWDAAQAAWLTDVLAQPTTYTFVVRHERTLDDAYCAGAAASTAILRQHPPTLMFTGHVHEFAILPHSAVGSPELVVGDGGAPLSDPQGNYGYVICRQAQRAIACQAFDYQSNAPVGPALTVTPGGKIAG